MKESSTYYLILVGVSFFAGIAIQGLVSLFSWTSYPIKAYMFSGVFWTYCLLFASGTDFPFHRKMNYLRPKSIKNYEKIKIGVTFS